MKRIIFLLVLTAAASITYAQETGPKTTPDPPSWKRYTVEGEEFSVLLPAHPAMTTTRAIRKADHEYQVQRQLEISADSFLYTIEVSDGQGDRIYIGKETDQKVRLLTKPEPSYTQEARANKIAGTVILKVVFTSRGTVENIHVIRELPNGLTERAIEAAKKIKFTPAVKDGHPVSMWMQLEYVFWP